MGAWKAAMEDAAGAARRTAKDVRNAPGFDHTEDEALAASWETYAEQLEKLAEEEA